MNIKEKLEKLKDSQTYSPLGDIFKKNWDIPLIEYSKNLYKDLNNTELEIEFLEALEEEFLSLNLQKQEVKKLIIQIRKHKFLQTTHHVTPVNGPQFFAANCISLAGKPEKITYLVAANSAIPFSNSANSGSLNYKFIETETIFKQDSSLLNNIKKAEEDRKRDGNNDKMVSIIPSKYRDGLIYNTTTDILKKETLTELKQNIVNIFPEFEDNMPFSIWAAKTCCNIEKQILNRNDILYFDINRVINRYLLKILDNKNHIITKLFFDPNIQNKFNLIFDNPILFFGSKKGKKSYKVNNFYLSHNKLISKEKELKFNTKNELKQILEQESLASGLILTFIIIRFLNNIRCFGSYRQTCYLEDYRKKLKKAGFEDIFYTAKENITPFTIGDITINNQRVFPLDYFVTNKNIKIKDFENKPMSFFWDNTLNLLIRNTK